MAEDKNQKQKNQNSSEKQEDRKGEEERKPTPINNTLLQGKLNGYVLLLPLTSPELNWFPSSPLLPFYPPLVLQINPRPTHHPGFEWHTPKDHWKRLERNLDNFASIGITNIWVPPACKASNPDGTGYDIFDLYDLGEFDQKGAVATKWGTKEELQSLSSKAGEKGIGIYLDAVLNHKAGAERTERCRVVEVDPDDRNKDVSEPYEIEAWLGFDFKGRGDKYSSQKYHW